jgi:hypothetical protein
LKKYLPALVAGFAAGVLHIVPVAKAFTCCLIVPFAAYFSIVLDSRANNHSGFYELKKGAILGLMTGFFAAAFGSMFDIFITFITKNNEILTAFNEMTNFIDSIPVTQEIKDQVLTLIQNVSDSIREYGFSPLYAISIIFNNLIVDTIFGLIGGLVGTKFYNSKINKS